MEFFQAVVPWHISEISWQNISSVPFLLPQHGCLGIVFRAESLIGCSPPRILRYPMRPIPSGLRTYDIFTIDVPFHKFEFVSFCWPQNPCFIWWLNPTRPMYNFGVTFWTRSGVWWVLQFLAPLVFRSGRGILTCTGKIKFQSRLCWGFEVC
jgi:hypothetical protein